MTRSENGTGVQMDWELENPLDFLHDGPEIPIAGGEHLHLYFGHQGRVPIGIDTRFPAISIASPEQHLAWAETLLDAGIYYQAEHQLNLLPERFDARACWLRARMRLVLLNNAYERARRQKGYEIDRDELRDQIRTGLEAAVKIRPDFGLAWLTLGQFYLEWDADFRRSLECVERALSLLGETPTVLATLGRTLYFSERYAEGVEVLKRIPPESSEAAETCEVLQLATLHSRCQRQPLDVEAIWQLGRYYLRREQEEPARALFSRLLDSCPERAEGWYGLAKLAFWDFAKEWTERLDEAYRLCQEALRRNDELGIGHELLGAIFRQAKGRQVHFAVQEPMACFQRAVRLDDSCDYALLSIADQHIELGEIAAALALLEKAAAVGSIDYDVYLKLAVIYQGIRQFEKHDWAYSRAKELRPQIDLSPEYTERILKLCAYEY